MRAPNRHAAAIYRLIDLHLQYMAETIAGEIAHLGEEPPCPCCTYAVIPITENRRGMA